MGESEGRWGLMERPTAKGLLAGIKPDLAFNIHYCSVERMQKRMQSSSTSTTRSWRRMHLAPC